ncbi:hypothetical protein CHGG_02105 [Chaetomium globosum CBS 148.51]|uniref:Uncharacterized protein n=1 Tax=Chaetomium globosum (strain ATCC 6205 / CBS 148.51 / DSM 1962 / NBRC 6347 / NRRL 1970) TaxID=306901 RepID=Q2HCE9_CHAGB|nr:uncharacterized protein CHGG_02105 [Chaetomium globosum CBS 148.51]EAQ93870.1 hypothetical protein CHGG_02105 [Chaetomium globosum CBS 148.51]
MAPIINIKININLSPLNLRLPSHSQSPSTVFEPPIDRGLRLSEPNVYIFDPASFRAGAAATMQTTSQMLAMSKLLGRIAKPANFTLTSNPIAFNNTMVSWLTDPDFHLPNGSIVGLCCSSLLGLQFPEDAAAGTDGLLTDFRRFLLATSLTHARWRDSSLKVVQARDICAAGQVSGYRLLRRLDRILTPQFLSRIGRDSCQVLFLLVLGAVLGVGYSGSQLEDHSPQFPSAEMLSPEFQRSPTLWLAMKEHLCQMLAHHLIFVGSMLGIKLGNRGGTADYRHRREPVEQGRGVCLGGWCGL